MSDQIVTLLPQLSNLLLCQSDDLTPTPEDVIQMAEDSMKLWGLTTIVYIRKETVDLKFISSSPASPKYRLRPQDAQVHLVPPNGGYQIPIAH
jgi:hypothetical protein